MLVELYIRNFAIIDDLRVRMGSGLNVLTGETGAGKSIIVDALGATLGQRMGSDVIRTGVEQAVVEALFELDPPYGGRGDAETGRRGDGGTGRGDEGEDSGEAVGSPNPLVALLSEHGIESEDGMLILSREFNRASGRTVARINSRAVPLSLLQQVGQLLVDIHGQSEHLSLLRVREHVDYLDRYAGLMAARAEVSRAVKELRAVRAELEQMARDERESAREIDLLNYQIQEIRAAAPSPDEEEHLGAERVRLRNVGRLRDLAYSAYLLVGGGEDQPGTMDLLAQAERAYLELARLDPTLEGDRQALEAARYGVEEIAQRTRAYAESVEDDPQRLNDLEERLELLAGLRRKYGRSLAEVLCYREEAEARLERLSNRAYYLDELRRSESVLLERVGALSSSLSRDRKAAAARLAEQVEHELAELNMAGTRFRVAFSVTRDPDGVPYAGGDLAEQAVERVGFDATGVDKVEFLVSPNPGEEPKPLARIASGGETARLMLALKTILSKADAIPTLVFDEIDVGVGARSGARVGEKLWRLTDGHQVLCITHLPQIACMADLHLSVAKMVDFGRTRTSVRRLERREQVRELAAMLAGSAEFASAIASAEELLARAEESKGCRVSR